MTIKGEHKMTDNWSLTGVYLYTHTNEPFQVYLQEHPQLDPGWNVVMRRPKVLALNSTHVVNPSTVVTLRAGWMSFPSFGTPGSADFDMASLGFPASYVNAVAAEKFPRITVLNMGQVGGGALIGDAGYSYTRDSSYNFNGTVSKLIGRHTIKVGADFRDLRRESASLGQTAGHVQLRSAAGRSRTPGPRPGPTTGIRSRASCSACRPRIRRRSAPCRSTRRSRPSCATTAAMCRTTGGSAPTSR